MTSARAAPAGRERELAELLAAFASARLGELRLAFVSGEPGIGKTTLLDAFAARIELSGARALRGACYDDTRREAYTPFRAVLRDLRRQEEHAQWPPDLSAWLRGAETAIDQRQLSDSIVDVLTDASQRAPVALLLDDLHWADEASVRLLRHLMRVARSAALMVVAAYRDTDLEPTDPFEAALLELNRERSARRLPLRRLDPGAIRTIVEAVLDAPAGSVTPGALDVLQRASEGVPFFAEELALHAREQGLWSIAADGRWHLPLDAGTALPPSVRSVIGHRLQRLTARAHALLTVAAVAGRAWPLPLVAEVSRELGDDLSEFGAALAETSARRLIVERAPLHEESVGAIDTFMFAHEQIREVLYAALNPIRRRAVHQAVGLVLERASGDDASLLQREALRLAWHFSRGNDVRKAGHYALVAAERALRAQAGDEAAQLFEDALIAITAANEPACPDRSVADTRFRIQLGRAQALELSGQRAAFGRAVDVALAGAEQLGSPAALHAARLLAARHATTESVHERAIEHARAALAAARDLDDGARLDALLSLAAAHAGRATGEPSLLLRPPASLAEARQALEQALGVAGQLGVRQTARVEQELGVVLWGLAEDRSAELAALARLQLLAALDHSRSAQDRKGELTALIALAYRRSSAPGSALAPLGDTYVSFLEEIRRLRASERQLASASERPRQEALALLSIHTYCRINGWLETALERGQQALARATALRDPRMVLLAHLGLSETERLLGRPAPARVHAEQALALLEQHATHDPRLAAQRDTTLRELAAARVAAGDVSSGLATARQRLAGAQSAGQPPIIADAAVSLAELLLDTNGSTLDTEQAARVAIDASRGLRGSFAWDIRAELALARLALASGDAHLAAGHAAAAIAQHESRDVPQIWVRVATSLGRALTCAGAGSPDDAREALRPGLELIERVAARIASATLRASYLKGNAQAAAALALARKLGMGAGPIATPIHARTFGDLTAREVEVLRLVAVGKTNRDIGATLFISEKTAARHLTNIFTKIDATSRTQAAAWAYRHGVA